MTNVHPTLQSALQSFAPPSDKAADAQRAWAQHNPFERASIAMVREAQKLTRQPRQPQAEPAPL
jgi:hypothetical protein